MSWAGASPFASRTAWKMRAFRHRDEIVVDGRLPAGGRHVEIHGVSEQIGMDKPLRVAVPLLMHRITGHA
jgi:hypothetical protein